MYEDKKKENYTRENKGCTVKCRGLLPNYHNNNVEIRDSFVNINILYRLNCFTNRITFVIGHPDPVHLDYPILSVR